MKMPSRDAARNSDQLERQPTVLAVSSRQARLRALLFAGASLGTTLLTLGGALDPKLPPYKGE